MKRNFDGLIGWLALAGLLAATTGCPLPGANDGGFNDGGGTGGGGGLSPFGFFDLGEGGPELSYLSMAVDPAAERVGVAYFVNLGRSDGGNTDNYDIRYVEYKQGVVSAYQSIREVQRVIGISLAFQSNGEPAVSYLGGQNDMSAFWLQSDAVVNYRSGGTTWTEQTAVKRTDEVPCGTPLDIGFLVGVYPSLVFDGPKAYLAWRDGHNGQFPMQDWAGSDLKVSEGGPTSWTSKCVALSGNVKQAYGARSNMIMANGQPALVHDRAYGGADTLGRDVLFTMRKADGTWTPTAVILTIGNTQSGASLAFDAMEGYGIAAIERSEDKLYYTNSADGLAWNTATPIFGSGSGGWFPSLAMDPKFHEPAVAFYICSNRGGAAEGACPPAEDELRIIQRISGNWKETLVDTDGAYLPKLGFFASGKRVVAYRIPVGGKLRLAVEH